MADQGRPLTIAEVAQILRLLADGATWKQIALAVNVSEMTIKRKIPGHIRAALPVAFGKNPGMA